MKIFIKAENYQVWRVIEIGDFEVTITNSNHEIAPKPKPYLKKEDFQKVEINAFAIKQVCSSNSFFCPSIQIE